MPRFVSLAAVLVGLSVLAAGCGGSTSPPPVATVTTTTSSSPPAATHAAGATTTTGTAAQPSAAALQSDLLKYAECMRASGEPNFPDPSSSGGFQFSTSSGVDPGSPVFKAAQAKCAKLMPGGGPPGPGTSTHPSGQWLAHMVKVANCMRAHGISDFPEPLTKVPSNPFQGGTGEISDIQGVIFVFPSAMDTQSPLFTRAAASCGFPLHNH